MSKDTKKGYGWKNSIPDFRDFHYAPPMSLAASPPLIDLRPGCPAVYDQSSLGSCHDVITEVLTDSGWKLFKELNNNDKLATVNPISKELIYENPTRIIKMHYDDDMYYGKNQNIENKNY